MKKIISVLLAGILATSLVACGDDNRQKDDDKSKDKDNTTQTSKNKQTGKNESTSENEAEINKILTFELGKSYNNVGLISAKDPATEKFGLVNSEKNKIIIPCEYDELGEVFENDVIAVKKDEYWGAIDTTGKIVIDFFVLGGIYDNVGLISAKDPSTGKYGLVNSTKTKIVVPLEYDELGEAFENEVIPVKKNAYWGAINIKGEKIIDFMYDALYSGYSTDNPMNQSTFGYADEYYYFDSKVSFTSGYIFAKLNEAIGIIDYKGEVKLALTQDFAGYQPVYMGKMYYIMDTYNNEKNFCAYDINNNLIVSFDELNAYNENYIYYRDTQTVGMKIIDNKGVQILDIEEDAYFNNITPYKDIFSYVSSNNLYVRDIAGNIIELMTSEGYYDYSNFIEFHNDFFICSNNSGYRDGKGQTDFIDYNLATPKSLYRFEQTGNIETSRTYVCMFNSDKYIIVQGGSNNSYELINFQTGEKSIPFGSYDFGEYSLIDWSSFDKFSEQYPGILLVQDEQKVFYGLWLDDKLAIPCEYTAITYNKEEDIFILNKGAEQFKAKITNNEVNFIS